jgi:hypothetical protein
MFNITKRLAAQQAADFEPIPLSQSFDVFQLTNNQNLKNVNDQSPLSEASANEYEIHTTRKTSRSEVFILLFWSQHSCQNIAGFYELELTAL